MQTSDRAKCVGFYHVYAKRSIHGLMYQSAVIQKPSMYSAFIGQRKVDRTPTFGRKRGRGWQGIFICVRSVYSSGRNGPEGFYNNSSFQKCRRVLKVNQQRFHDRQSLVLFSYCETIPLT